MASGLGGSQPGLAGYPCRRAVMQGIHSGTRVATLSTQAVIREP
jgi:hypothetical protein